MVKLITIVCRTAAFLAALLFLACALVISIEIVARYSGRPTSWAQDFALYFMISGAFLCQASILLDDGHVRVDVFISMMNERTRTLLIRVTMALALIFIAVVFWYTLQTTLRSYRLGLMSTGLFRVPIWMVQVSMPIGFGLLFLAAVVRVFKPVVSRAPDELDQHMKL